MARVSILMFTFNHRQLLLDADKEQSGCVSCRLFCNGTLFTVTFPAFVLQPDCVQMCCG